jgi:hypothetical protein
VLIGAPPPSIGAQHPRRVGGSSKRQRRQWCVRARRRRMHDSKGRDRSWSGTRSSRSTSRTTSSSAATTVPSSPSATCSSAPSPPVSGQIRVALLSASVSGWIRACPFISGWIRTFTTISRSQQHSSLLAEFLAPELHPPRDRRRGGPDTTGAAAASLCTPHALLPPRVARPTPSSFAFEEGGSVVLHLLSSREGVCLSFCFVCWRRCKRCTVAAER